MQLFYVPILRHFWYWLGVRRADRATMNQLLSSGTAVVLCPGGVQARDAADRHGGVCRGFLLPTQRFCMLVS